MNKKLKKQTHANRRGTRKPAGYALVAIMTVSVFALMLLFTLAGLTASLTQSEGYFKQKELALVGAEVGLEYAQKQLNRSLETGVTSLIEPAVSEQEKISELPVELVPKAGDNCRVMIRVKRLTNENLSDASQKASPAVPYQWNSAFFKNTTTWAYGDDWRRFSIPELSYFYVVEVTSYRGIFATSLRATLSPDIGQPTADVPPASPKDVFFPYGVVSDGTVELASDGGYLDVMSPGDGFSTAQVTGATPNAAFKAVVQSNSLVSTSDGTTVYGDLKVTNAPGATSAVASGNNNVLLFGRLDTNSVADGSGGEVSYSGFSGTAGDMPGGVDNVWAFADWWQNGDAFWTDGMREGLNETAPIANQPADTANQTSPNPVPYGSDGMSLPPFPEPPPPESGDISQPITVEPGTYRTGSFDSTNANANLVFNDGGGPTTIFIDDNLATSSQTDAVNIDTSFITNLASSSTDLQIYYAGNRDINIAINGDLAGEVELKALIYAPNANVTTTGFGEFHGAIVSKQLKANHIGDLRLDPDAAKLNIARTSSGGGGGSSNMGTRLPTQYRVASWQQLTGALVPTQ